MYKSSDVKILKKYYEGLNNTASDTDTKQKFPVRTVIKIITAALLIGLILEMTHGVVFSDYEKQFSLKYEIYALAVFTVIFYAVRKIKLDWRSKRIFPDSDIFIRYMTDKVKDYFGASGTYDSGNKKRKTSCFVITVIRVAVKSTGEVYIQLTFMRFKVLQTLFIIISVKKI